MANYKIVKKPGQSQSQKLLMVGLACVDVVNVVKAFPEEDTKLHDVVDQLVNRGGNASNTSVILSQLGSQVEWLGTLAKDSLARVITDDLDKYGVLYSNARYYDNCTSPLSCVIITQATGSRTVLHKNKTLPDMALEDFQKVDLREYAWIHFEGRRSQAAIEQMISEIEEYNARLEASQTPITVSLEAEKYGNSSVELLKRGDYVFISKDYSRSMGYTTAEECLTGVKNRALLKPGARAVCAWGEQGAWGLDEEGRIVHSPAYPPMRVVDTLGAGDSFNGGVLFGLSSGRGLEDAVRLGCVVAGHKVGRHGLAIDVEELKERI